MEQLGFLKNQDLTLNLFEKAGSNFKTFLGRFHIKSLKLLFKFARSGEMWADFNLELLQQFDFM